MTGRKEHFKVDTGVGITSGVPTLSCCVLICVLLVWWMRR